MNISIQGKPQDGKILMDVYLDDDDTPNNASIQLWVDYDDSMKVLRQNTLEELTSFLEQSLRSAKELDLNLDG